MARAARQLILIRHAHRDKDWGQEADNGLSRRGKSQARAIQDALAAPLKELNPVILTSPKARCRETVQPLAKELSCPIRVFRLLDEQKMKPLESAGKFMGRIRRFLGLWEKKGGVWVACSHGDWIPQCLKLLQGREQDVKKGDWVRITPTKSGYHID